MTIDDTEDVHKNWLFYNDTYLIDVSPSMTDIVQYRASLGHKINHQFQDVNVDFCYMKHPRFGNIRCTRSLRLINKGEEIFEDYQYEMTNDDTPRWYKDAYKTYRANKIGK